MTEPFRVIIAGAGLGGLCLAQGLRKAGIDVLVVERDAAPYARGQGHRVHLDSRGQDALRACLPEGLFELFEVTRGQPSERFMLISAAGPQLEELPVPDMSDGSAVIRTGWAVSRLILREILLADLGDAVRFGAELTRYAFEDGVVRAHFADGGSEVGDVLVGADGIGSAVRAQYLPDARVIDTGVRWIGGKTPITDDIVASLPTGLATAFAAVTGMETSMLVGYLRFQNDPVQAAERLWPGLRITDTDDYVMWAITFQKERNRDLSGMSAPDLLRQALELTEHAHPVMRDIVERCRPEQLFHLAMGTSVPVDPWKSTQVTLLGDAIHAMPPARGSGANTALADAGSLCHHLVQAARGRIPLLDAIADYEADMITRGFAAVQASTTALDSVARDIVT